VTHTALCRLWKESLDSDGQEEFEDTKGVIRIGKLKHTARLIAKCSTKPLSKLLTSFLSDVNIELQSSCDISYSKDGVNQCRFWRYLKIVYSTYSQGPSPAITFKHLTQQELWSSILTSDRNDVNNLDRGFVEHLADPAIYQPFHQNQQNRHIFV
jgi:hypothetical protein